MKSRYYLILLGTVITIFTLIGFSLANDQYRSFSTWWAMDIGQRNQTMYNLSYGKDPLFQTVYNNERLPFFSQHVDLIMFLILPFYIFKPDVTMLLLLQTLFLSLGAIPIFLMAQKVLKNKNQAVLFSLIYLLNPLLHWIVLSDLRFETYVIFFLLLMIYFYIQSRYKLFLLAMVLALSCNETNAPVIASFGLLTLIARIFQIISHKIETLLPMLKRGNKWSFILKTVLTWKQSSKKKILTASHKETIKIQLTYLFKWCLVPIVVGLLWFIISARWSAHLLEYSQVQIPRYGPLDNYSHFGSNAHEIIAYMREHTRYTFIDFFFEVRKTEFLKNLLLKPFMYIPILSPTYLIGLLPTIGRNFLLNVSTRDFRLPVLIYYFAAVIPFLITGAIQANANLSRYFRKARYIPFLILITTLWGFYMYSPIYKALFTESDSFRYQLSPRDTIAWQMIASIPKNAPTATNHKFTGALSSRQKIWIYYSPADPFIVNKEAEYILVDTVNGVHDTEEVSNFVGTIPLPADLQQLISTGDWQLIDQKYGLFLLAQNNH